MINFHKEEERVPSILIVLSLLILLGALIYMVAIPKPSVAGIVKGREKSKRRVQDDIKKTYAQLETTEKIVRPRLWKEEGEAITPLILAQLTQQATAQKLRISAFRPQRLQVLDGVTEVPYSVYVNGSYTAVLALLKGLDAPKSKVILRSTQISSSDPKTSTVTAVIGVSVYHESAEVVVAPTKQEGKNGKN